MNPPAKPALQMNLTELEDLREWRIRQGLEKMSHSTIQFLLKRLDEARKAAQHEQTTTTTD